MRLRVYSMLLLSTFFACSEDDPRVDLSYTGESLRGIYAPMGGAGTGSIHISGRGCVDLFDIPDHPAGGRLSNLSAFFMMYAAREGEEPVVRMLAREPLADAKSQPVECDKRFPDIAWFDEAVFRNGYPVVDIDLLDEAVPLDVRMTAWAPIIPADKQNCMLPAVVIEWTFTNKGKVPVKFSVALAMEKPFGTGDKNVLCTDGREFKTPYGFNEWNGFTLSSTGGVSYQFTRYDMSVLSSFRGDLFLQCSGEKQDSRGKLWNDYMVTGKLPSRHDSISCSTGDHGIAAMCIPRLLDPGESVTIPFLFIWLISDGQSGTDPGERHHRVDNLDTGNDFSEQFTDMNDLSRHVIEHHNYLRDRTMQFSYSMVTSTITEKLLETVLAGFSHTVEKNEQLCRIFTDPFADAVADSVAGIAAEGWDYYQAASGYAYEKDRGRMTFAPAQDVLPVRFFWATATGWGTIDVSRARIVLKCIHGSVALNELILDGRSFFVFREFVPSRNAVISYKDESLTVVFAEKLSLPEGEEFTMEIP